MTSEATSVSEKKEPEKKYVKFPAVFEPLLAKRRYKGAYGGRGSGKSQFFAILMVIYALENENFLGLCVREYQKSLKDSSWRIILSVIERYNLKHLFEIQQDRICTKNGGEIIFLGMQNYNAGNVKSVDGIDVAWVEEAQSFTAFSWDSLRHTVRQTPKMKELGREPEIWASWNPRFPTDPVDNFFRGNGLDTEEDCVDYQIEIDKDPDVISVEANYNKNEFFPKDLYRDLIRDKKRDPDAFAHTWGGGYATKFDAQIMKGKFRYGKLEEFLPSKDQTFYYGVDWGYNDPTVLVRCWLKPVDMVDSDDPIYDLMVDWVVAGVKIDIDDISDKIFKKVPGATENIVYADHNEKRTIRYLNKRGLNLSPTSKKRKNAITEGIRYLRSFRKIVIHPQHAKFMFKEMCMYSWKVDKMTGEIDDEPAQGFDHSIDALRYALNRRIETGGKDGKFVQNMYSQLFSDNDLDMIANG